MDNFNRKEAYIECFFEGKTSQEDYNYGLYVEDYVPEKWRGEERNFLWEIPQKERFWHDGDELILDLYTANGVVNNG